MPLKHVGQISKLVGAARAVVELLEEAVGMSSASHMNIL